MPKMEETGGNRLIFVIANQGSGDSGNAVVSPFGSKRNYPVMVRLLSMGDELLLRMDIIGDLGIAVDFGKHYFQIG